MSVVPVLFIFQILDGFSVASGIVFSQAADEPVQNHYISFSCCSQVKITCFRRGGFQVSHPRGSVSLDSGKKLLPYKDVHTTNQGHTSVCPINQDSVLRSLKGSIHHQSYLLLKALRMLLRGNGQAVIILTTLMAYHYDSAVDELFQAVGDSCISYT